MNNLNKNTIVITLVSIAAIFGFLFLVYSATNKPDTSAQTVHPEAATITADDHTKWSEDNEIILVEYGDLQCPACKAYHDVLMDQIEASPSGMPDVTQNITFVYRHYPLTSIHKHAMEAAQAAEAAGRQDKFYEMIDKLFDTQDEWEGLPKATDHFIKLAGELELDEDTFTTDMNSSAIKDKIQKDMVSGNSVQVQGTPTFYLEGKKLENVDSFEKFKEILANAAKE